MPVRRSSCWWVTLLLVGGCGRSGLGALGVEQTPITPPVVVTPCPPSPMPVLLVSASGQFISSLAAEGNELYVASHERVLPMRYRLPGAVERFPRCGGPGVTLSTGDDRPSGLALDAAFVHWTSVDHDFSGANRRSFVTSSSRASASKVVRERDARQTSSQLLVANGSLHWLESREGTVRFVRSPPGGEAVDELTSWSETAGAAQLDSAQLVTWRVDPRGLATARLSLEPVGRTPLWTLAGQVDRFAVGPAAAFFVQFDTSRRVRVLWRQPLQPGATPTELATLGLEVPFALTASAGAVYLATSSELLEFSESGARRRWPLPADSARGELVSTMVVSAGRLYVAVNHPTREASAVWVVDVGP